MSRAPRRTRAVVATAIGLALVAGGAVLPAVANAGPTTIAPTTELDYYRDAYPGLGAHSVFEAVANERFEWLLQQPGVHAFLIGGPEAGDPTNVSDEITHVDAVAQDLGVPEVFNWDPHVDGADNPLLDVRTSTDVGVAQFRTELLGYLDAGGDFDWSSADAVASSPYLFLFDKDHKDADGNPAPVVAKLSTRDLTDPAAYESAVRTVLSAAAPQASSTFTYWKTQADAKHLAANASSASKLGRDVATDFGSPVIGDDADDAGFRIETITYPELVDLLKSDGRYVLLFGGTWCPNTRAIVNEVNQYAQDAGVEHVYQFDWHQYNDNDSNETHLDLRQPLPTTAKPASGSPFDYLYGNVVNTYLTNLQTQYGSNNQSWISYDPTGTTTVAPADTSSLTKAQKLQVPTVLEYDRSNTAGGAAAPVVRHWIEDEGNGTYKEYMSQLAYVQAVRTGHAADLTSLRYTSTVTGDSAAQGINALASGRTFAASALTALSRFFAGTDGTQVSVTAPPQSATVEAGQDATFSVTAAGTPAGQVQWQSSADGTNWAPVTEWTAIDGSPSLTVPAVALSASGTQYRAVVTNGVGPAVASAAATLTVNPAVEPADPTTTAVTLAVTGTRAFGQSQVLTATVTPAADGTVTFRDGAAVLGTATVAAGTASRSVALAVGTHALSAAFVPTDSTAYAASESAAQTVAIAAGSLTAPTPTVSGTAKVGVKLTAKAGTWTAGTKLAYQWFSSGAAIKGATASTFTPVAAQKGHALTVRVTGSKAGYTTVAKTSKATAKVAAGTLKTATPKVSGTAKVGKKLTAKAGSWTSGTKLHYQWYADGKAIKGATKSSLTLKSAQHGKKITVKVTGSKSGYTTVAKTSKKTGKIR